jgi:hypothetical protein
MKTMLLQILVSCLLLSCTEFNRNILVDKSKLTGSDYRLFQDTPAWELAKAVQDGNEKKINEMVKKDSALVNCREPKYGETLLMLTIMNQQMKSFKALLANKADISIHNTFDGTSALIVACSFKQYDNKFAEILLQQGANVNDVEVGQRRKGNTTRLTPLIAASEEGNLSLVKLLVSNGADINYQNEYKQSALSQAAILQRYNVVLFLLQNGANYASPIFYRFGNSFPYNPEEDTPMYLVDVLRENLFETGSMEYKYKMQIVDFLKAKGIDYWSTPIPEYIKKKAQEEYPGSWQEYLEKY